MVFFTHEVPLNERFESLQIVVLELLLKAYVFLESLKNTLQKRVSSEVQRNGMFELFVQRLHFVEESRLFELDLHPKALDFSLQLELLLFDLLNVGGLIVVFPVQLLVLPNDSRLLAVILIVCSD